MAEPRGRSPPGCGRRGAQPGGAGAAPGRGRSPRPLWPEGEHRDPAEREHRNPPGGEKWARTKARYAVANHPAAVILFTAARGRIVCSRKILSFPPTTASPLPSFAPRCCQQRSLVPQCRLLDLGSWFSLCRAHFSFGCTFKDFKQLETCSLLQELRRNSCFWVLKPELEYKSPSQKGERQLFSYETSLATCFLIYYFLDATFTAGKRGVLESQTDPGQLSDRMFQSISETIFSAHLLRGETRLLQPSICGTSELSLKAKAKRNTKIAVQQKRSQLSVGLC
ncbi:uncharacterized protein LOC120504350 [Passer montanus]|uniref:uncharacterized protein LOC120504350 n=1 Tax=Passer montanus TaxID=9160 RepID=UPI001961C591|nr:uncharacterized protein LOC120504350 [Passer montanus]